MKNRRNPFLLNLLLAVVCLVLFAALAVFLLWNHRTETQTSADLQALAEKQVQEEEQTGAAGEDSQTEENAEESPEASQADQPQTSSEETADGAVQGIACWGDEFYSGEEAAQYSYRSVLQRLLSENGYDLTVADKTLTGASTLSVMKMAGVPQTDLDAYITAHQQAANGGEIPVTETGIRDLTPEQTDRFEKDYIPVLFMGYYGGWNHDTWELIEQQQKVLDTFGTNKDKFIIIGLVPLDGSVGLEDYDGPMKEAWGEHYISSAEVTQHSQATHEGQEEIAQALYQKLIDLNYISKAE